MLRIDLQEACAKVAQNFERIAGVNASKAVK